MMTENKTEYIEIQGAKVNNLKNISLFIPRNKFVVMTGLSGSGKSSLAFDTICAEGRRRYIDTLSPYAKNFMQGLQKPDVDEIKGLSPVVSIEQKTTGSGPRSTVGTITEIYDFLRLLYSKISIAYSPVSGEEMVRYKNEQIIDLIIEKYNGRKCYLLAPMVRGRKGHYKELFEQLRKKGYSEVRVDGKIEQLCEIESLDRYKIHFVEVVADKLKPGPEDVSRIKESVGNALKIGKGTVAILDHDTGIMKYFSKHYVDPETGISFPEPAPHTFSFNSPEGYCPNCKGLGIIADINIDSIIPDRNISIAEGGIVPLGKIRETKKFDLIRAIAVKYHFSLYEPIAGLPEEVISLLIFGSEELFRVGESGMSEMKSYSGIVEDIQETIICPECNGRRLKKESLCFKIKGKDISEVSRLEIGDLYEWICDVERKTDEKERLISSDIIKELKDRIRFILNVGLDYLSLDRATSSLSGGESQRIRLATQIGAELVNVLYILDEPSIGLHQSDNRKLIRSLKKLRDDGNSVIVVEHDLETMCESDWITDIGKGAGEEGGEVCINAPAGYIIRGEKPDKNTLSHCIISDSVTFGYLSGKNKIETPAGRRKGNGDSLILRGARGNNLKNTDIEIPLGCFIGISGVSGSGKSSLINQTLMPLLKNKFYNSKLVPLPYSSIEGVENIDKLIEIDQKPIGKSPRSNPATFTGVFNDIRNLFAETTDAKVRGFDAGRFSFNVSGGRCEECKGAGIKIIEMNFMPSVNVTCDKCLGKRYKDDTLMVKYKGKTINDVLNMQISDAYEFFKSIPSIEQKLKALKDVGLGYVRLGQSATTLSGGESQRMKLASELFKRSTGNTLYILDEPTTGLHFEDIKVLLGVLQRLVDQGNTVIVIEHNMDVLKSADYIFDMGPKGGKGGGMIIAQGTPEEVASNPDSVTGAYLKEVIFNGTDGLNK